MGPSRIGEVFAAEWPKLVAVLRREFGDLETAEDAAQDAFAQAAAKWGTHTTPEQPGAWLLTAARRRVIDQYRRDGRFADRVPELARIAALPSPEQTELVDDQLALIFGCCHDALHHEAQIALTLREVCGLSTDQIAKAFLVPTPTMAKRLVRAKDKIRKANIPFNIPGPDDLPGRLDAVLRVIYLIFTVGHTNSDGPLLIRGDLCDEARWLCRLVDDLVTRSNRPGFHPGLRGEIKGLLALMLFNDSRRDARVDVAGNIVLLQDQDRTCWDHALVAEGQAVLASALRFGMVGEYQLQAAIAGLHATATDWDATNWRGVVSLYSQLAAINPSPVVALNRAAAVAMADGPDEGLRLLEAIAETGTLDEYRYFHAARADLLRRLERDEEAVAAYQRALELTENETEVRFLESRLSELE